jgi:hypothetical protein
MKLVDNWHRVLLRSYSMWCVYLAGLAEIIPSIVPFTAEYIPTWASIALLALSPLVRIIHQHSISRGNNGTENQP